MTSLLISLSITSTPLLKLFWNRLRPGYLKKSSSTALSSLSLSLDLWLKCSMTRDLYRSGSEDVDNEDDEEKHTEEVSRTIIHQEAMTMMNT